MEDSNLWVKWYKKVEDKALEVCSVGLNFILLFFDRQKADNRCSIWETNTLKWNKLVIFLIMKPDDLKYLD